LFSSALPGEEAGARSVTYQLDIPAEDLQAALQALALASHHRLLYRAELVAGKSSKALIGTYTTEQAVGQLLEGTELSFEITPASVVLIKGPNDKTTAIAPTSIGASVQASSADDVNTEKEAGNNSSRDFRVAQVDQSVAGAKVEKASEKSKDKGELDEIVVTAQRRYESAQNVPMGLTVLLGEDLTKAHSFRIEDFAGNLPGLTLVPVGGTGGAFTVESRGLTTGTDFGSMTAIYLDETSYLPSSSAAYGEYDNANFDTYDMARIEFLKGPQGTLYGANAAGGLLKYVTNAPDPSGFSATVQGGLSTFYHGDGLGSDFHGMVNVPLTDDLAMRVVGYDNYYPGFTDDIHLGAKDINWVRVFGGRGSLLWRPKEYLSIQLNALYQRQEVGDSGNGTEDVYSGTLKPIYGPLVQNLLETQQPAETSTYLGTLTINWDAGPANLVSVTSYHVSDDKSVQDLSPDFLSSTPYFFPTTYGVAVVDQFRTSMVAQEMRLSSKEGAPFQWLAGGYFTDQRSKVAGIFCPVDLTTHQTECDLPTTVDPNTPLGTGDPLGGSSANVDFREYAAFANVEYHFTPELDVALGGRYSSNTLTLSGHSAYGALGLLSGGTVPDRKSRDEIFTYSTDVRWHFTPETMLYARLATGYQPGGTNQVGPNIPPLFKSSTTTNYEVGFKGDLIPKSLAAELALYHIKWKDIPITVFGSLGGTYITNAGVADSDGVEWQLNFRPIAGLTLGLNGSYDHAYIAELTTDAALTLGANIGERLPYIASWQGSITANYERPLLRDYSGFIGANAHFSSARLDGWPDPRPHLPSYGIFDLRTGFESSKYSLTFYVKNLFNSIVPAAVRPSTPQENFWSGPFQAFVLPPQTIGVTLAAKF
jgi:outer membrane receptor protein involved in Fe transport